MGGKYNVLTVLLCAWWYIQQGDPEGERSLAVCYEHGEGVAENEELAFKWYEKAAAKEDIAAQHALSRRWVLGRSDS